MEDEKVLVLQFRLTRDHCILALAFAFLCLHPRPLGSETLTLTTYYPAPYGGYVSMLTTSQTLLARDSGNVGIGTSAPVYKLEVTGDMAVRGNMNMLHSGTVAAPEFYIERPGSLRGLCSAPVRYTMGGGQACSPGYRVMTWYGTGGCPEDGILFLGGSLQEASNWSKHKSGSDCEGYMLCCRIDPP